jgi:hypothetical protein
MANDLMRVGPRGSSEQAAWEKPIKLVLQTDAGVSLVDKSGGASVLFSPGSSFGTDYKVVGIELFIREAVATADISMKLGTLADDDAYISDTTLLGAVSYPENSVFTVDLESAGGTATATTFGATNGPLMCTLPGGIGGTGTYFVTVLAEPVSGPYFSS